MAYPNHWVGVSADKCKQYKPPAGVQQLTYRQPLPLPRNPPPLLTSFVMRVLISSWETKTHLSSINPGKWRGLEQSPVNYDTFAQ